MIPKTPPVMTYEQAMEEAQRCLLCHDAPCSTDCGAGTDPARFIRQFRMGNLKGAIRTIRENNILGAVCAYVCPTCRLCGRGCIRAGLDVPIRIREIQAFLMEWERKNGLSEAYAPEPDGRQIAIVGSGPAGLSAAAMLARNGYQAVIFEKDRLPGGTLRYGIPGHRLPEKVLDYETDILRAMGVDFRCGVEVAGADAAKMLLTKGFDAVFLAPGLERSRALNVEGSDALGLYSWKEFLRALKHPQDAPAPLKRLRGKRVAVIGGGAVAMDCAVSARLAGADRVYCLSLEAMEELPADQDEVLAAVECGVRFRPNTRVTGFIKDKKGRVTGLRGEEIRWIKPGLYIPDNAAGVPGSSFEMPADYVVLAIGAGFSGEQDCLLSDVKRPGAFVAVRGETMKTSARRIYAGGDITGPNRTVASCIMDGKRAAETMIKALPLSAPVVITRPARPSLEVEFCGIRFSNPFCLSSSPVSNTAQMVAGAFEAGWGGAVFKTLNLEKDFPIVDPTPRLNALHYQGRRMAGLQNIEMISERPFQQNLKDIRWLKKRYPGHRLIVSIMGYSPEGWQELARGAEKAGADMLELNFSCPQMAVEGAGHKVGQSFELIREFTKAVKEVVSIPVMAKMTPNITDMLPAALAAKQGGADAISAINTVRAITEIDLNSWAPKPTIEGRGSISGYSGPACKPIALRFVAELANSKELSLPISGMGGIETWPDAAMFLLAGAATMQVTTAVMHYGQRIIEDLCEGLEDYLAECGAASVTEIIGGALKKIVDPSAHHQKKHVISHVDEAKCIGCGLCHIACRDGANQAMGFDPATRKAFVDEDRCVGCLLCRHVCPVADCIGSRTRRGAVAGGMHEDALRFIQGRKPGSQTQQ